MFDIGFFELLVIATVGLIVIGPKRLPEVVRTVGLWIGRLKRSFSNLKRQMQDEFQLDEVRRQLHNEEIMSQLEDARKEIEKAVPESSPSTHDYEPLPRDATGDAPDASSDKQ